jgi:hypothetical protein
MTKGVAVVCVLTGMESELDRISKVCAFDVLHYS